MPARGEILAAVPAASRGLRYTAEANEGSRMPGISTGPVTLDPEVSRLAPTPCSIRRTIHRFPEPGFDEAALPIGVQVLVRAAERHLGAV